MGGCLAGGSAACKDATLSTLTAANQEALLLCPLSMPVDFLFSEDGAGSRNEKGDEGVEHGGSEHSNFNTGQWLCSKALCCQSMGGDERHGKSVHNHVTQVQSNSGSILWRWEERCGARACNCRLPDPAAWIVTLSNPFMINPLCRRVPHARWRQQCSIHPCVGPGIRKVRHRAERPGKAGDGGKEGTRGVVLSGAAAGLERVDVGTHEAVPDNMH